MDANARQAVVETVYLFAYALDALDEAALTKLFTNPFHFDISALMGVPAKDLAGGAEYYKAAHATLGGFDGTQHLLDNPVATFSSPEEAHVKVYASAYHGVVIDNKVEGATARVCWLIDLVSEKGEWIIEGVKIQPIVPVSYTHLTLPTKRIV